MSAITRCQWVDDHPLNIEYHDQEWGVPVFDDQILFEFLLLEGLQAGLSWLTILKKREHYRHCLAGFDMQKIARFSPAKIEHLLQDPALIRNRLKMNALVINARAALDILDHGSSLSDYLWRFVDGKPVQNHWRYLSQVPTTTPQSDALSKALKKEGFKFVGSTICYAFMQAVGMANDHTQDCQWYPK